MYWVDNVCDDQFTDNSLQDHWIFYKFGGTQNNHDFHQKNYHTSGGGFNKDSVKVSLCKFQQEFAE